MIYQNKEKHRKRFISYTLIFTILGCSTISLFAYNDKAKKTVNKYWAGCIAEDWDGPLFAEAYIIADIDYPGEGDNWREKMSHRLQAILRGGYGIHLQAYARVDGEAPRWNGKVVNDYGGEYDLYASVCYEDDAKNDTWEGEVDEKVKAEDFIILDVDRTNWDTIRAINQFPCWAWGDIDGSSPEIVAWKWVGIPSGESGSETRYVKVRDWNRSRPALSHNAVADVWNFSFYDTRGENKWNCFFSGDTSCPECGGS